MRIGPCELSSHLFLSPLAGYTNLPFRLVVREIGGLDWVTTDLVKVAGSAISQGHGTAAAAIRVEELTRVYGRGGGVHDARWRPMAPDGGGARWRPAKTRFSS